MQEEESDEGFSLYEFYMNGQKTKVEESNKSKEGFCIWNKLCSDVEDVFDSDGFATKPDRRIGHSSIYLARNNEIYIFGGRVENESEDVSDLWKFHIPTREWTEIYPNSKSDCWPLPSFDHAAVSVSLSQKRFENFLKNQIGETEKLNVSIHHESIVEKYHNQMYIFGGYNTFDHFSRNLYCFDFTLNKFIKIPHEENSEENSKENILAQRSRHSMISVNDRYLYIIGGMTEKSKTLMDVWEYDIDSNIMKCVWKHCEEESNVFPQPRHYHSCVYSKINHSIYMFGGIRNSEAFQDLWRFDLKQYTWFPIDNMKGFVPVERFKHVCFISNEESDFFFVYGGYNFRHSFLDYVYQFCFSTLEWTRLQNRNYTRGEDQSKGSLLFVDYNEIPTARSGMSSVVTRDGDLIIFGGKAVTALNDMYICHLPGYTKIREGKQVFADKMLGQSRDCLFVDLKVIH